MSGYPSPLTVRAVKQVLKDGMYEAGLYGAASVVDALVGTFWGSLFTRSNRRDYLNFLGELAGRSITNTQQRIASNVYAYENLYTNTSGKPAVKVPAKKDGSRYYNKDNTIRQNGHTYDSVPYENKDKIVGGTFRMDRHNNNKPKPKDHSVLDDAVFDLTKKSQDFSISDFFKKIKEKVLTLVNRTPDKKQAGKDVLQGCYEFLEEQGYDGKTILVNILTSHERDRNFSEVKDETVDEFNEAMRAYSNLSDSQKIAFQNAIEVSFGKEGSKMLTATLQKADEGITIPASAVRLLKLVGLLTLATGILKFSTRTDDHNKR